MTQDTTEKPKPGHLIGTDRVLADRMWRDPDTRQEFEDQTGWRDPAVGEYHVAFRVWAVERLRYEGFRSELEQVINRHSMERHGGDTPDFLLAQYLTNCLMIFDSIVKKRDRWYGNKGLSGSLATVETDDPALAKKIAATIPDAPDHVRDSDRVA